MKTKATISYFIILNVVLIFFNNAIAQTPNGDMWEADNFVYTMAVDGNYTYIGGYFNYLGPHTGSGAKLTTTSSIPDMSFPIVNGYIKTTAPDGSGGWYIGGSFTKVGSYNRKNIAHINSNGTVDENWNPNSSGIIYAIIISGSDIYVGGLFSKIGGLTIKSLARLNNTDGSADSSWNPNPTGTILAIAISGSDIYAAGNFTSIGGITINNIAKLNNTDGSADSSWNPNPTGGYDSGVHALATSGGDIYAGGWFTSIGGLSRPYIAKLNNTDGSADPNWNPAPQNWVEAIAISGNDIYIGGYFSALNGIERNHIGKVNNTNGSVDASWNPGTDGAVLTIAIDSAYIYIGGSFTSAGGKTRPYIAKLNNTDGSADPTWDPNAQANETVNTITVNGSDIYVGGNFTSLGGQTRNNIAKLNNTDGSADPTWDPNANSGVEAITISGSDIYVGGYFSQIGGLTRYKIAKLNNTDGSADTSWDADASTYAGGTVNAITISGSDIYVGGVFTTIGGQTRRNIAKLNYTDGSADTSWHPAITDGTSISVNAISINGSDIYAGGKFYLMGGQTRYGIAKLNNTDGSADPSWDANLNYGSDVRAIVINGNDIYVGGDLKDPYFIVYTDGALPVELTGFTANFLNNEVHLNWQTATEVNNYGFEIQRTTPHPPPYQGGGDEVGGGWKTVGFANGSGNSNSPKEYSFTYKNIKAGTYKYRLKQIDNNGTFEYSDVVEVSLGVPEKFALEQNYPNPFNPTTKIKYSISDVGASLMKPVTLKVYDVLGEEVKTLVNEQKPAGNYEVEFDASNLSSGVYFYTLTAGDFSATKKLILLK